MSCCSRFFDSRWLPIVAALLLLALPAALAADAVKLTHDGRLKRDPRFVGDSSQVVYSVVESPTIVRQMKLDLATGAIAPLYPKANTSQFESTFSADGRYHAFVEFRGVTNVKLVIRDTRSGNDAVFDPGSDRAHLGNPAFDPRGERIVFSLPRTTGQQLVSINAQATDLRRLTQPTEAIDDWAAFSPDGSRIAFGSSRDGDFEIYVMRSDGSHVRRLTDRPGMDIRPAWSPDGRTVAFTSARDGNYEIYSVGVSEGSQPRRLTNHEERDDFAQWHPDGRHLIVISERGGESDLYRIDAAAE